LAEQPKRTAIVPQTTKKSVLQELSQNMREEQDMVKQMEAHHQAEPMFWRVAKLPPNTNPHQVYPSKTELI
jgi:hypothetical protein